jgi:hypothetical protein
MTGARLFPLGGIVLVALLVFAMSGCGGSDSEEGVPAELVGTYTTTLHDADIPPNSAPELEPGAWELVVATTGAADGGSVLAIKHPEKGLLEGPGLRVDGDRFLLEDEECAQDTGYVFYDNEYSWRLTGSTLTLTTVENECPDHVAETILTSQPWTKES